MIVKTKNLLQSVWQDRLIMFSRAFLILLCTIVARSDLECNLDKELINEIQGYQPLVKEIIEQINGPYKNIFYNDVADFVDKNGPRPSGTIGLERAIDDVIERQRNADLEVTTHQVLVPKWTRGEESAEIVTPRRQKLSILGLGSSSNTSAEGITARVIVVKDFDELEARKAEVPGNIVLFNAEYVTYGTTGVYRNQGPNRASLLRAAAVLVRSITPFSINSPHTGQTTFQNESLRIPSAAITLENANLIARLVAKGENVTVNIKMSGVNSDPVPSRNVIADIVGSSKPEEYVVISGHIDSWDVGQGAMDDAGGAFLAYHSLALIKKMKLEAPQRTLRAIMWTAEETGLAGVQTYKSERREEVLNWTIAFESDMGVFKSLGINVAGSDEAVCIMREIASLFQELNATEVNQVPEAGSDISVFIELGIPTADPYMVPNNYFWYHHSDGDWVDIFKSEDLDQNLAIYAATTYIIANLSIPLPRVDITPNAHSHTSSSTNLVTSSPMIIAIITMSLILSKN